MIENGATFDEIVETVDKHEPEDPWGLSDPLHLLKNLRTNSLFRDISITLTQQFNQEELKNFVKNRKCVEDNTSIGAMKDSYPNKSIGYESFIASLISVQTNFFICPIYLFRMN